MNNLTLRMCILHTAKDTFVSVLQLHSDSIEFHHALVYPRITYFPLLCHVCLETFRRLYHPTLERYNMFIQKDKAIKTV